MKLVSVGPAFQGDLSSQLEVFENLVAQGAKAIGIAPVDSAGVAPAVTDAMSSGIPIIAIDTGVSGADVTSFVATDNYAVAKVQGAIAATLVNDGDTGIYVTGNQAQSTGQERRNGFMEAFSAARPGSKILEDYINVDETETLDWEELRKKVKKQGMRNSNVMAIAPTATISNITGVTQSIEPTYQNLYVKSNLSGEFTIINPHLVEKLKELELWDDVMINDLKYYEGSLAQIGRIPDEVKNLFMTAFEVEPRYIVESASRRQKWIDQAQSLNLYIANASGKKLDVTYRMAWLLGLKTTYYLRSLAATTTEKSTVKQGALNAVSASTETTNSQELGEPAPVPDACSIDDPDCEACQ